MSPPFEALRDALVRETVALLRDHPPTEISIRDLARRLGVSSGAPFHHFEDRAALFAAVALDGWRAVHRRLDGVPEGDPDARLPRMTREYLAFALEHPEHYRVRFLAELKDAERFAELHAISFGTFGRFLAEVARIRGCAPDDPALVVRVLSSWSTIHGFALLTADGTLEGKMGSYGQAALVDGVVAGALRAALG